MRNTLNVCTDSILTKFRANHQLWFGVALALSLGVSSVGVCGGGLQVQQVVQQVVEQVKAEPFPQLSGLDLVRGGLVRVKVRQARLGTVVVFLSMRCPCSASHQSILNQLSQRFTPLGFQFIGVHSNADEEAVAAGEYFRKSGLIFPVIQDNKSKIADTLGAFKTPHVFVLNPEGEVLFQGGVDNSHVALAAQRHYLRDALALIVEGKKPAQKEVRVLGCEIRR